MAQIPEHDPAQSGWQSLLPRLRRSVHRLAIRLFWPPANSRLFRLNGAGDIGMVRSSYEFQFVHGCPHLERFLFHCRSSCKFFLHSLQISASLTKEQGGLMYIQDIFYFHEHPRKINIWSGAIIVSPYLGPLIAAFIIDTMPWPNAFWVNTGLTALCWLLVVFLMDETIYNRRIPVFQQIAPKSRVMRLIGVEQWKRRHNRQSFWQAIIRPIIAISKIPILLCTIYYFLNFAWIIGVNATISIWLTNFYKFTPYNLGKPLLYSSC